MKKRITVAVLAWLLLGTTSICAAPQSTFNLQVRPKECSVDQVHTGPGQATQVSPESCNQPGLFDTSPTPLPLLGPEEDPSRPQPALPNTPSDSEHSGVVRADKATEPRHTIETPLGRISQVGKTIAKGTSYATFGLAASVPLIFVADALWFNGRARNAALRFRSRFWPKS